jgi:hypothetical protein
MEELVFAPERPDPTPGRPSRNGRPGRPAVVLDLTDEVRPPAPGEPDPPERPTSRRPARRVPPPRRPLPPLADDVAARADRLVALARLLTARLEAHERPAAENLMRDALAREHADGVPAGRVLARRAAGPWWWPGPRRPPAFPADPGGAFPRDPDGSFLRGLDRRHRAALVGYHHLGLTPEQTALLIGAPAGNVRSWLHRTDPGRVGPRIAAVARRTEAEPGPDDETTRQADRCLDIGRRIEARRRRRRAERARLLLRAAVVLALLALTLVAGVKLVVGGPRAEPEVVQAPADGPGTSRAGIGGRAPVVGPDQFELDFVGLPAIASSVGDRGQARVALRFTPARASLTFSVFCRTAYDRVGAPEVRAAVTLDGHDLGTVACGVRERVHDAVIRPQGSEHVTGPSDGADRAGRTAAGDRGGWAADGVHPGQESRLRAELRTPGGRPASDPLITLGVAVYQEAPG